MSEQVIPLSSGRWIPYHSCLLALAALLLSVLACLPVFADVSPVVGIRVSDGRAPAVFAECESRTLSLGLSVGMRAFSVPEEGKLSITWISAYLRVSLPIRFLEPFAAIGPTLQQYRISHEELSGYVYLLGGDLRIGIEVPLGGDRVPLSFGVAALVSATTANYTYVGVGSPVVTWEVALSWRFP